MVVSISDLYLFYQCLPPSLLVHCKTQKYPAQKDFPSSYGKNVVFIIEL